MFRNALVDPKVWVLALFMGASSVLGQEAGESGDAHPSDPWGRLKMLEGSWEGAIDGKLGTGKAVRRYEFIMGGRFLLARHLSVRLPQENSREGDEHEELAVFSIDGDHGKVMLREFLSEGVVVLSTCEFQGQTVVCVSESVESGPGIRARLALVIEDRYRFQENYEIAWSEQQEMELYFTNKWTRVPEPQTWD